MLWASSELYWGVGCHNMTEWIKRKKVLPATFEQYAKHMQVNWEVSLSLYKNIKELSVRLLQLLCDTYNISFIKEI